MTSGAQSPGFEKRTKGSGPTGLGDRNPATCGGHDVPPLGSPREQSDRPDFTPPFPSYPSGHAGFGGEFSNLRLFYGRDDIAFTVHVGPVQRLRPSAVTASPGRFIPQTFIIVVRRQKRQTVRAAFTWGSTGRSIKRRGF